MSTLNQDMQPTSDTYAKRWQLESDEAFEGEVESQLQYVFQDEVRAKQWCERDIQARLRLDGEPEPAR